MKENSKTTKQEEKMSDKRKFKKGNSKDPKTRKFEKDGSSRDFEKSPRTNDLSWYTINDQLLRDAGSLSFNNPLGNTTRISELSEFGSGINYYTNAMLDKAIPGLMAIEYVPTIGPSTDNYSPINIAARSLFSNVRKVQSGRWNYEPADLMKYILALDSCYMMYAHLCRIYGAAKVYSVVNRYWPDAVLKASHVDRNDVIYHLSDLRYYINTLAHRLNTLCAPSGIKLFDRHFFMNVGIWKDADYDKAQLYMFVPRFIYKYEEMNTTNVPAELIPLKLDGSNATANNLYTVQDLINMTETLVNSLMASEDIGVISGDLYKAYGLGGSHALNSIDENFEVYPVFDPIVLSQIHNTRFLGGVDDDVTKHKIIELTSQDGQAGALVQTFDIPLVTNLQSPIQGIAHVLDFDLDLDQINPGIVMEGTRLTVLGTVYTDGQNVTRCNMDVYGSELPIRGIVYGFNNRNEIVEVSSVYSGSYNFNALYAMALATETFNMHPLIFGTQVTDETYKITTVDFVSAGAPPIFFDINNYTIVGKTALRKLHEVAMLALLNMPYSGQYQ